MSALFGYCFFKKLCIHFIIIKIYHFWYIILWKIVHIKEIFHQILLNTILWKRKNNFIIKSSVSIFKNGYTWTAAAYSRCGKITVYKIFIKYFLMLICFWDSFYSVTNISSFFKIKFFCCFFHLHFKIIYGMIYPIVYIVFYLFYYLRIIFMRYSITAYAYTLIYMII